MTSSPIDLVIIDAVPVSKPDLRSFEKARGRVTVANVDEIRNTKFTSQFGGLYVASLKANFDIDTADTTSDDDGVNIIKDLDGNIWKNAGYLQAADNLSDVVDVGEARDNLGLGTAAVEDIGTSGPVVPKLDGANTWSGAQTFGLPVTLPGDPTLALQAATKQYVDGIAANLGKRQRVRAATTANVAIATALNNADMLDGVTLAAGDLVLVKNQTAPAENGVYVVGVTPVRSAEFDTYDEFAGSLIAIEEGSVNADTIYICTSNVGGTLGSSAIAYSKLNVAGELFAANNLSDLASASAARTNLGVAIGTNVQAWDADLDALAGLSATGLVVRTAINTFAARAIAAGSAIDIVNPDGIAGSPTIAVKFNNTLTGGIDRTGIAKMGDIFSACDFGVLGNNSSGSASANLASFNAAVAAAALAGGAQIVLPRGITYVSGAIVVLADNIEFVGEGPGISVIKTTSATDDIFRFGDGITQRYRVGVRNMSFGTSVAKTAGAAVKFNLVQDHWFEDWFTDGMFESCRMLNCTVSYIAHGYAINAAPTNGRGIYISGGNDQYMNDILIASNPTAQARCGYEIESTGGVWMNACGALQCGTGVIALPNAGNGITWMFTTRCAMDTGTGNGWLLQVVAGAFINGWMSIGDWSATNAGDGVVLVGSAITGCTFQSMRVINNGAHGFDLQGGVKTKILGCLISSNSQTSAGTKDGINISAGVSDVIISGSTSGNVFSNTQRAGLRIESGASDNIMAMGNDFRGNTTPITNGATGSEVIIKDNLPTTSAKTYAAGFSAHKNGTGQTGVNTSPVKVTFTTEQYDTGGFYDAPNSKWTPPAGPISIKAGAVYSTNIVTGSYGILFIYKNGSLFKAGTLFGAFSAGYMSGETSIDDIANGTDYYEVYSNLGTAINATIDGGATNTWFMGMVR